MPLATKAEQSLYQTSWLKERRLNWIASQGGRCARCGSIEKLTVSYLGNEKRDRQKHRIWSLSARKREIALRQYCVLCGSCHEEKHRYLMLKRFGQHSAWRYRKHGCRCYECTAAYFRYLDGQNLRKKARRKMLKFKEETGKDMVVLWESRRKDDNVRCIHYLSTTKLKTDPIIIRCRVKDEAATRGVENVLKVAPIDEVKTSRAPRVDHLPG